MFSLGALEKTNIHEELKFGDNYTSKPRQRDIVFLEVTKSTVISHFVGAAATGSWDNRGTRSTCTWETRAVWRYQCTGWGEQEGKRKST